MVDFELGRDDFVRDLRGAGKSEVLRRPGGPAVDRHRAERALRVLVDDHDLTDDGVFRLPLLGRGFAEAS